MSALTSSYLSSQPVSKQVLLAYKGLTTVFDMRTGEPLSYRHQIEATNQNFDVFPKFFVSRFLSIAMLRSFQLFIV